MANIHHRSCCGNEKTRFENSRIATLIVTVIAAELPTARRISGGINWWPNGIASAHSRIVAALPAIAESNDTSLIAPNGAATMFDRVRAQA
jgi:hypothetical protein